MHMHECARGKCGAQCVTLSDMVTVKGYVGNRLTGSQWGHDRIVWIVLDRQGDWGLCKSDLRAGAGTLSRTGTQRHTHTHTFSHSLSLSLSLSRSPSLPLSTSQDVHTVPEKCDSSAEIQNTG